ncbi:hypothetical protein FIBSPDRAFT_948006 [Athelia psychrophila]|uniref:F-box domain-containing protein n=1 Tax=Athelia psychrophila TaxID=1759441 RepID=A0A166RBP8_9AGAM|nr:hypothetical protein FIBSPDRAFT_948006 [Fibularhizoctonia sp. CBS 109695]
MSVNDNPTPTSQLRHLIRSLEGPNTLSIMSVLSDARQTLPVRTSKDKHNVLPAGNASLSNAGSVLLGKISNYLDVAYQDPIAKIRDILHEVSAAPHIEHGAPLTPALSPISRLPEELKSYIFYLCQPHDEDEVCARCLLIGFRQCSNHNFDDMHVPLLLTQVSKEWRSIALYSQRLWSHFTICSDLTPPTPSMMRTWLSRAKSSPLHPNLHLIGTSAQTRRVWPAVAEMVLYCDRWETLFVAARGLGLLRRFKSVKNRLHTLKVLQIIIPFGNNFHQLVDAFEVAPRLREVHWYSTNLPPRLKLPWGQLTVLALMGERADLLILHWILRQSHNLSHLKLEFDQVLVPNDLLRTIALDHLIIFDLAVSLGYAGNLLERLHCPHLRELELQRLDDAPLMGLPILSFLEMTSAFKRLRIAFEGAAPPDLGVFIKSILSSPRLAKVQLIEVLIVDCDWLAELYATSQSRIVGYEKCVKEEPQQDVARTMFSLQVLGQ